MTTKRSAGFIVFTKAGKGIRYLLLHHGGDYWNFPKGTQEAGETDMITARRELAEETGIKDIKIMASFEAEYDYDFDSQIKDGLREKIHKTVIFFLGEVGSENVEISHEHVDFGWFDYDIAFKRLFHQNSQDVLKKAHQFLLKQQDFVL